jgi:excinuclease ABC subunit C
MSIKRISFYPGDIPAKSGVYVFRDRFGEVIYVGKASNLRKRMSQYFQPSRNRTADPKLRSLINSIDRWEYYTVKNEDESLILETRFIKDYAPRYNVLMRDDKRFLLIKINLKEKFPRLVLARVRKDDSCVYFGPFPKSGVLRPTVDFLTRYFGIRQCRPQIPTEKDHKHCLASIIRDCCEPCIGRVNEDEYRQRIDMMMKVLEGNVKELIVQLRERMEKASTALRFEQAANFRDMISNIEEVFGARNRSFRFASIESSPGDESVEDLRKALKIENIPATIEGFDISNIGGQMAVASLVCFKNGRPSRKDYRRFRIREVDQADDFAMMREAVKRHFSRRLKEDTPLPDLLLVDGGKGQLSSALEVLVEINCPPFPIIGLAKKQEEIFIPGKQEPILLDKHRPALKLLQAVRDEAHRFAVSYHRQLRGKRLQESLLDEIPGIGAERKKILLKAFGSVSRLRKASVDEIAAKVPGIGRKFAGIIFDYLQK